MNTFLWIIAAYITSFLVSRPFVRLEVRHNNEIEKTPLSDSFIVNFLSAIPFLNLWLGYEGFRRWVKMRVVSRMLKRIQKNRKIEEVTEEESEEFKKKLGYIIDDIDEINRLTE